MNLDDALQTFIVESTELLQQMEDALLVVEQQTDTAESVAAIFRAAHTIKGSAGLFGLDAVVSFTHAVESVLDRVRGGELPIAGPLVALLLEACDHIGALVAEVSGGEPDAGTAPRGLGLLERLRAYLPGSSAQPAALPAPGRSAAVATGGVASDTWHISLRFGAGVLVDGMDPLACLRYLATLGDIERIETLADGVPGLEEIEPEASYLGFEIRFRSDADKHAIESAFEFVRESSEVRILPPHSRAAEYVALIRSLPEEELQLGQILVRCGTLTEAELAEALREQREQTPPPLGQLLVAGQMVDAAVVDAAVDRQKQIKETRAADASFIRVDARRLDLLINLVGELIITGAGAHLIAQRLGDGDLLETTFTMSRLVEEVRDSALNLRMVQIGATFNRFQRVVHDVSRELGKDIRLEISGEETELDKTVVERIGDPLTHLVRNSMDHGIEPAEARVAAGKPAHGTVKLNAYHDSGTIVIEVADDGGGLNHAKILAKARERGLVGAGEKLSDAEIRRLIFEPGFSTADQVSNLSGRGVGMDVVRRNILALRGTVDVDSEEGRGTTIRIHLPLTLAIIDGFLVGVGDATYVVPLDMVVECIELSRPGARREWEEDDEAEADAQEVAEPSSVSLHDGSYLNLRGEVLPYLALHEALGVPGDPAQRQSVVVVQYAGRKVGLVVDRLLGEFQTVIKPLSRLFARLHGVGGSTILGSGEVALILDVPALVKSCTATAELAAPPAALHPTLSATNPIPV
ncbi:MAG TPA: chemotaxis protein CheA [Rhodocyclaceae bacterium]